MENNTLPSAKNSSTRKLFRDNLITAPDFDESDLRFFSKQAFLQSVTSTVFLDTAGKIITANKAFEDLFGIPINLFIKNDHSFLTDPELVRKGVADSILKCIKEKKITEWTGEFNIQQAAKMSALEEYHDKTLYLRVRLSPLLNDSGDVDAIVLQHEDMTLSKKLESDLYESNQLLNTAQIVSKTGHFSADLITGKWNCSDVLKKILGIDNDHINSVDDWGGLIADEIQKESFSEFIKLKGNNEYYSSDFRIKSKKDGEIKWVSTICRIEKDSGGKPLKIIGTLQDITERKLIEQELADSSRKYQTLVEQASDSIFVFNREGKIIEANNEGCRALGYSRDELLRKHIWELIEPENHKMVNKSIQRMESGETVAVLRKLIRKDGEIILTEITGRMLSNGFFQAIARDVTERNRLEEIFREREHQFSIIFDNMPIGVVFQDEVGFITMANPAAEVILGLTLAQLQGKHSIDPDWRAIHEDGSDFPGQTHPAIVTLRTGKPVKDALMGVYNPRIRNYKWIKINSIPEFNEGNERPSGVFTTFEDVTEIRLATLALQESEKNYKKIFNATSDSIFIDDASTGRIIDVNETVLKMYGYDSKDEVLKLNIGELSANNTIYNEDRAQSRIRQSVESGPQIFEWRAKKKTGELFWVEVSLINMDSGSTGRVLAVARDITERKKAEEKIKRYTLDLKNSNATKDKFLSIIAHDLRSPFHTVLGLSEILYDEIEELKPDDIKRISLNLQTVLRRQYELVNDLLDWANLQSKDYKIRTAYEDFEFIVSEIFDLMKPVAEVKGITLRSEVLVPVKVKLDAQMIRLVLRNLISNSVKFSETGSVITLDASIVQTEGSEMLLKVTVTDTGTGIPSEVINQLFRADVRYTRKGTREEKGSGLGLLLCYEVIKKHEGKIEIISDTGKGCKVSFTIPVGNSD